MANNGLVNLTTFWLGDTCTGVAINGLVNLTNGGLANVTISRLVNLTNTGLGNN